MLEFLNSFTNPAAFGNILNTLYANASDVSAEAKFGNFTIMWNTTQIGNATYQNQTLWPQFADAPGTIFYFLFEVLGKIFEAYSIQPPSDYETKVSEIAGINAAPSDDEIDSLVTILVKRFLTAAICFLASCVSNIV